MKHIYTLLFIALLTGSCSDYLAIKPDKSKVIPSSLQDLSALLENTNHMNTRFPSIGLLASDELLISYTDWQALSQLASKNAYIWADDVLSENENNDWSAQYRKIFISNVVLDGLEQLTAPSKQSNEWSRIKGAAHFFRAYALFELAQLFCKPYNQLNLMALGLPLRLSPDPNQQVPRSTIEETYTQIINDLIISTERLPNTQEFKTQPSKIAALAMLARVYLAMEQYALALKFSEQCLAIQATLIDFNYVNLNLPNPFPRFNEEVIFHAIMTGSSGIFPPIAQANPQVFQQYEDNDLRKEAFYIKNADGSYSFKGSFDGTRSLFSGLAFDEIFLIKAEALARIGRKEEASEVMNNFLTTRYKMGTYNEFNTNNDDELLQFILSEREKELCFRGSRWTDLRRLNFDARFQKSIIRHLDRDYVLAPEDERYVFLIPEKAIILGGIEQNNR